MLGGHRGDRLLPLTSPSFSEPRKPTRDRHTKCQLLSNALPVATPHDRVAFPIFETPEIKAIRGVFRYRLQDS